ncbi:MAG TPA: ROK family protein [Gemmatimonadales bacterium]|nr:ROK family protein [Gemmatimonadales bacterium]
MATLTRYHDRLGRALAALINTLDPDIVVLGGGMSNLVDLPDRSVRCCPATGSRRGRRPSLLPHGSYAPRTATRVASEERRGRGPPADRDYVCIVQDRPSRGSSFSRL